MSLTLYLLIEGCLLHFIFSLSDVSYTLWLSSLLVISLTLYLLFDKCLLYFIFSLRNISYTLTSLWEMSLTLNLLLESWLLHLIFTLRDVSYISSSLWVKEWFLVWAQIGLAIVEAYVRPIPTYWWSPIVMLRIIFEWTSWCESDQFCHLK